MFKKGDIVKCIKESTIPGFTLGIGSTWKVLELADCGLYLVDAPNTGAYAVKRFELVIFTDKNKEKKMQAEKTKWEFTVASTSLINYNEIGETLTHDHQVAWVTTDNKEKRAVGVAVHSRIVRKSEVLQITCPSVPSVLTCGHYFLSANARTTISDIMRWVKIVRAAEWKYNKYIKVTVRYPEL